MRRSEKEGVTSTGIKWMFIFFSVTVMVLVGGAWLESSMVNLRLAVNDFEKAQKQISYQTCVEAGKENCESILNESQRTD